jgi:hypothetical protein
VDSEEVPDQTVNRIADAVFFCSSAD